MNIPHSRQLAYLGLLAFVALACQPQASPKPRGYFRIEIPKEASYTLYAPKGFPYHFEVPSYAEVIPYTNHDAEPYWVNIHMAQYNANLHISYKPLRGNLSEIMEDVHYMVYKHTIKADDIVATSFEGGDGQTHGLLYQIEGNAASNLQFYLTDEQDHFLRGALYFNTPPNYDSLSPIIQAFTQDIRHLMLTTEWR